MAEEIQASLELLGEVPLHQRERIVSGMRWTVWLAALAMPFSYATTILLARVSPEAIGTYGLLMVYIAVVQGLFYLGGDAVAIKFMPELAGGDRLSFLATYFVVTCAALVPWLLAASLLPNKLHYLLGENATASFQLFILFLSPICILASLSGAALKGILEIGWAQILARILTIGFFILCATFFIFFRSVLAAHYTEFIWGCYLGLCTVAALAGVRLLVRIQSQQGGWQPLRFFLPRGFWRYTLSLQQLSAIGFFINRFDVILVLNFGDLATAGKYVAIITLAETIQLINRFFLDTLLPSLTNMVASQNWTGATDVFSVHARILFLVNTGTTCGLILLAAPLVSLLGAKYSSLISLVVLLSFLIGLAAPSTMSGALLSSTGKQQRAVWVSIGQVGLYVVLFVFLWPRWHLLGAVLAYGISTLVANPVLMVIARYSIPFRISILKDYLMFGAVASAAVAASHWLKPGLMEGALCWIASAVLFLFLGQYGMAEIVRLLRCFLPFPFLSKYAGAKTGTI